MGAVASKANNSLSYVNYPLISTTETTYLLTPWSRVLLEKLTSKLCRLVKKFPAFMEPESSSPYPQVPATLPYPEPTPSSPHDPLQVLKIHLNIILPSTSWSPEWHLSLRLPHQHPVHPSILPHTRHIALPISFVSILPPAQYWVWSTD